MTHRSPWRSSVLTMLVLAVTASVPAAEASMSLTPIPSASRPTTVRTDWTKFHFDPANTGINPYENVLAVSNVAGLTLDWSVSHPGYVSSSPAVVNGIVYSASGTSDGTARAFIYAHDSVTGELVWIRKFLGLGVSDVSIANGMVYASTIYDHAVRALNAATGATVWKFVGDSAASPTNVVDRLVYVGAGLGNLDALNARTGKVVWSYRAGLATNFVAEPAVADGVVYAAGGPDGKVYALDAGSGHLLWSRQTGGGTYSSPAVANGVVYFGSQDFNLYALRVTDGRKLWSVVTGREVDSSPAVAGGLVYVGSHDHSIYAIDVATGLIRWQFHTHSHVGASPIVANGVVYIGSQDHKMYALDAATGTFLWSFTSGNILNGAPAVVNGTLYFGSFDGDLYAFRLNASAKPDHGLRR